MPDARNEEELKTLAAWMYYDDGLTQAQIADRLRLSRIRVTRLLQRARDEGIVEIRITRPLPLRHELARRLQREFGLREAILVKANESLDATLDAVGRAGAEYLRQVVFPRCRVGIGWSTTVSRMAPHLRPLRQMVSCTVNELAGSFLGQHSLFNISAKVAETLAASIETLPVPVVVQSRTARDAILAEEGIRRVMDHATRCDIAFVGLGDTSPDGTMVRTGYLTPSQLARLHEDGAVGEILMRYFDTYGNPVATPLDTRIVSLDWEAIRRIPIVVVLAAGPHKIEVILGALRGRLCHCLVTDIETAQEVLRRAAEAPRHS